MFFNIVEDLFESIERLRRSVKIHVGSTAERIIFFSGLRKKYLTRCQILRSKDYLYTLKQKVFFNTVKVLLNSFERILIVLHLD